jgi:hypothetical protein
MIYYKSTYRVKKKKKNTFDFENGNGIVKFECGFESHSMFTDV